MRFSLDDCMGLFMYVTEMYTYYLVFSHSPTLLHVNGCKINCSMDVNTIFFFPSIAMAHDQHHDNTIRDRAHCNNMPVSNKKINCSVTVCLR